jgi:hypothetical protein
VAIHEARERLDSAGLAFQRVGGLGAERVVRA